LVNADEVVSSWTRCFPFCWWLFVVSSSSSHGCCWWFFFLS
jgi:hypothetical protein